MSLDKPLKIIIVGGVAGGMSAATRARRLSEEAMIIVLERGEFISYANCGLPYSLGGIIKSESSLVLQNKQNLEDRFNLDIRLHSELKAIDRAESKVEVCDHQTNTTYKLSYDKLILAQGAVSILPPITGINLPHVFTLQTIPELRDIRNYITQHECKSAAVIGGGFIGLEAAENLQKLGLQVDIIEKSNHVFPPFDEDMASILHTELKRHVSLHLGAQVKDIQGRCPEFSARIILGEGQIVDADIVVVGVGVRSRSEIARNAGLSVGKSGVSVNIFMQTSDPCIYAVGDMVETEHRIIHQPLPLALGGPANRQGRIAADHILGEPTPYRGNIGTFVCQIFDMTAAITGMSVASLSKSGFKPAWITIHAFDHATYYPGASAMTLRLAFEPGTGRLLGAQAVGASGVDKRIDTLSVALQAGMSVFDLEHLELSYAPPYGSAKDPVNMAGFVSSNVLRGQLHHVHPDDVFPLLEQWQILDVRSADEFSQGHLPHAQNIPVNAIRRNVKLLEKERPVLVYCWVGYRGYLAYRILRQCGFSVANLDGGYKLVVQGGFPQLAGKDRYLQTP